MIQPGILDLVNKYRESSLKKKDILREILQQSALLGLARHNFFEHAAFYGETALRILYGLDRFSEDLDFSLLKPNAQFNFQPYLDGMQREMASLGFHIEIKMKDRESPIVSAFLKANTLKLLLTIEENAVRRGVHGEEKIPIKLEIDTNPPPGFEVETKLVINPAPFYVLTYKPQDLFAGKMHAILCREWKSRVKGRDWFDFIWFIKNQISVHLAHLQSRMRQSGHLPEHETLDREKFLEFLKKRIATVNWDQAKNDVRPFISDPKAIDLWSASFFMDLLAQLRIE